MLNERDDPRYVASSLHRPRTRSSNADVDVAWTDGATITASGNSFAAPVIAANLARVVAADPGITSWQARPVLAALAYDPPRSSRRSS